MCTGNSGSDSSGGSSQEVPGLSVSCLNSTQMNFFDSGSGQSHDTAGSGDPCEVTGSQPKH